MATNVEEWTRELAAELAPFAPDMWTPQKRLEGKGFRWIAATKCLAGGGWRLTIA
jgi:hypothetical protein